MDQPGQLGFSYTGSTRRPFFCFNSFPGIDVVYESAAAVYQIFTWKRLYAQSGIEHHSDPYIHRGTFPQLEDFDFDYGGFVLHSLSPIAIVQQRETVYQVKFLNKPCLTEFFYSFCGFYFNHINQNSTRYDNTLT